MSRAFAAMREAVEAIVGPRALLERHPFQVVGQALDGTLSGYASDDSRSGVPIYVGLPGVFVRVKQGAIGLFGFIASDRKKRMVNAWQMIQDGASVLAEMVIASGTKGAARNGDAIEIDVSAVSSPPTPAGVPTGGTITVGGVAINITGPVVVVPIQGKARGVIVEGSSIVKIG